MIGTADPPKLHLRVAIIHDWMTVMGGAEQVVDRLLGLFSPTPDIYTFHADRAKLPTRLSDAIKQESRLASLPGLRETASSDGRWRWLLPFMPHFFESLDLRGYDLVISASHACAAGVKPPPGTPHLVYCYTPMRYAWMPDMERSRFGALEALGWRVVRRRLRAWDLRASARPTAYVAISAAVAERIAAFYGRSAVVIHPPVAVDSFRGSGPHDATHFLWVNRFVAYKRPLEVVRAFAQLPNLRLTMVGVGPLRDEVLAYVAKHRLVNVDVPGWVDSEGLTELYRHCGAFVHIGEEDFGISMVEAQSAGLPVLAVNLGGAADIVGEQTGLLLRAGFSVEDVSRAAASIAERTWDRDAISASATRFAAERFDQQLTDLVTTLVAPVPA